MNCFPLLLLAVVAASPAPSSARSVLSMALDLLPDLQAIIASTPADIKQSISVNTPKVDGSEKAITFFIPVVRKALYAKAQQEKTEVDPQTMDTLDRMERVIPGVINLVGAISSGTPLGLDDEFFLPDFTKGIEVIGTDNAAAEPSVAATATGVESENAANSTPPESPRAQELPAYASAPQVPVFPASEISTYVAGQVPAQAIFQAPAATLPNRFDLDAAFKVAKERGTHQTADGVVSYVLPGGGFFYATGY